MHRHRRLMKISREGVSVAAAFGNSKLVFRVPTQQNSIPCTHSRKIDLARWWRFVPALRLKLSIVSLQGVARILGDHLVRLFENFTCVVNCLKTYSEVFSDVCGSSD